MKNDKKMHFAAGLLIAALVALPCYLESVNLFAGLWTAVFTTVIAAVVKEFTDYLHTKTWDWKNFLATCLGAIVVVLLILGLHFGKG